MTKTEALDLLDRHARDVVVDHVTVVRAAGAVPATPAAVAAAQKLINHPRTTAIERVDVGENGSIIIQFCSQPHVEAVCHVAGGISVAVQTQADAEMARWCRLKAEAQAQIDNLNRVHQEN